MDMDTEFAAHTVVNLKICRGFIISVHVSHELYAKSDVITPATYRRLRSDTVAPFSMTI